MGRLRALREQPDRAARLIGFASMYAWSHGHLAARGHLEWLASLPLELRLTLPDGPRLLANHAAPGSDGSGRKSLLLVWGGWVLALRNRK